jgi:glucose-1-phosphate cytidylyltransferase
MQNLIKDTPVLILCGGKGSRLSEETKKTPKPLIKLDKYPILYHIIQIYIKYGFRKFVLLTGYKHQLFEKYFFNELPDKLKQKPTISKKNKIILFKNFEVKILNTGLNTLTGARILKYKRFMQNKKYFAVTYGDGLANINLKKVFKKFYKTNFEGIMCATNPLEKFGTLKIKNNIVTNFREKEKDPKKWINIGFFIFNKIFFKYLDKHTMLEKKPLKKITNKKKLMVYKHIGLYNCMDTLHEKKIIQNMIKKKLTLPWLK